jgi:hypothetical protein
VDGDPLTKPATSTLSQEKIMKKTKAPVPKIKPQTICVKLVRTGEAGDEESVGFLAPGLAHAHGYVTALAPEIRAGHHKARLYEIDEPRVLGDDKGRLHMVGIRCAVVGEIRL